MFSLELNDTLNRRKFVFYINYCQSSKNYDPLSQLIKFFRLNWKKFVVFVAWALFIYWKSSGRKELVKNLKFFTLYIAEKLDHLTKKKFSSSQITNFFIFVLQNKPKKCLGRVPHINCGKKKSKSAQINTKYHLNVQSGNYYQIQVCTLSFMWL